MSVSRLPTFVSVCRQREEVGRWKEVSISVCRLPRERKLPLPLSLYIPKAHKGLACQETYILSKNIQCQIAPK